MDPEEKLQMYLEDDWERASTLQSVVIPRAVRWYTGEAVPERDEVGLEICVFTFLFFSER